MIFLGPESRGERRDQPQFLSAIEPEGPCDGSHGRFCPECADVIRWADRDATRVASKKSAS